MSMRSSCIAASFSALALLVALPAGADSLGARLGIAPPDPVLVYEQHGEAVTIMPRDVAGIEISESGGITDIFLRLEPEATGVLAQLTASGIGAPLVVRACGAVMLEAVVQAPVDSGTFYIHGTTAARAEAIRALWHGRLRCDTVGPEVFEHGQ
jgi:hypothetical protein